MLVKMRTSMAGEDFAWQRGEVVDMPDEADARRIVAKGYAVPVAAAESTDEVKRGPGRPRKEEVLSNA